MKTIYDFKKIKNNFDCFDKNTIKFLYTFKDNKTITVSDILNSNLNIANKINFLIRDTGYNRICDNIAELEISERKDIQLKLLEIIAPKFNDYFPDDTRVIDCLEAYKKLLSSQITKEEYDIFNKACYSACKEAYKIEEFGIDYDIAYSVYAMGKEINGGNSYGINECCGAITHYADCSEKALDVLMKFFNVEKTNNEEDISIDILEFIKEKNMQELFNTLDDKNKFDVLVKLIDYISDDKFKRDKFLSFLKHNKKILKNIKEII